MRGRDSRGGATAPFTAVKMSSGEEGYESDHFEDDHDEIEEHISSRKGSMVSYPGLARNLIAETHEMGTPFQPPAPGTANHAYNGICADITCKAKRQICTKSEGIDQHSRNSLQALGYTTRAFPAFDRKK